MYSINPPQSASTSAGFPNLSVLKLSDIMKASSSTCALSAASRGIEIKFRHMYMHSGQWAVAIG